MPTGSVLRGSMVPAMVHMKLLLLTVVLAVIVSSSNCQDLTLDPTVLEFLPLGNVSTVETEALGHFDDAVSQAIHIPGGFPFGNRNHNQVYISTNGYFSFEEPFYSSSPEHFPGFGTVSAYYIVAPFWDDIDIRRRGDIFFEVHINDTSSSLFSKVNNFVAPDGSFSGTWMVVAQWDMVHSWPDGESEDLRQFFLDYFGLDTSSVNTFQAILITDGTASYTVFTYRCGSMGWSFNGATIGYNAAGDYFENHPNTGSFVSHEIACLNRPGSEWFNVVYNISVDTPGTLAPPPTVEPAQLSYLDYLEFGSNYLEKCRNCSSSPIPLNDTGLPFGSYYHDTVYVGNNGVFSFGEPLLENSPATFPTLQPSTYYAYIVAPFWSDIDTRLNGSVRWQVYSPDVDSEDLLINIVEDFINIELGQESIANANWMLVATWVGVHPFPHGNSVEEDRLDPYLQRENTFQGIIISNGTKVYAVFTYVCADVEWSDAAVIGFNAGGESYQNHPLSGKLESKLIGCVHAPGTQSNNVVYDLSEGVTTNGTTPEPFDTVGTCAAAGYTECCDSNAGSCFGSAPADCFCDVLCVSFGDCCRDQPDICQTNFTTRNDTYLLYSDHFYIGRLSLDGEVFDTLPLMHRDASALDFDYARGFLYWYDRIEKGIFRSGLDGSEPVQLVNTSSIGTVEDIAVDWVSNKLYWTETLYRRIEVLDLDTLVVAPVLDADPHSGIRGIAVDPTTRYMYWTDWGEPAKIERSSMDGTDRRTLHSTGLGEPNGITIDYQTQTIYWTDSGLGVIDYSNTDGTNRRRLQSNLLYPYAITVEGSLVFFTDWFDVGVHATHKLDSDNVTNFVNAFTLQPTGIEAIASNRQAEGIDMCDVGIGCDHMCLLSSSDSRGYSCICKEGYELDIDGQNCTYVGTAEPPEFGSCGAAAYNECCNGGYCVGNPPNCFCDSLCRSRGDCCSDIGDTCPVEPSSCSAAGYDTCCSDFICVGISEGGACYCDDGCRSFGDCCDDIDTICPLPTTVPPPTMFPPTNDTSVFQFLTLNTTEGVTAELVGHFDDGVSHSIFVPQGFPFGDLHHSFIFISTNGILSFSEPFYGSSTQLFPGFSTRVSGSYLVAPFWSDVDVRLNGNIKYEVHSDDTGLVGSAELLRNTSDFISVKASVEFIGSWMLVVSWEDVHPWPNGEGSPFLDSFYPDSAAMNSFQGIVVTDGVNSYSLFTYKCGEMEWSRQGVIGFNAAGQSYENHVLSSESFVEAPSIACSNSANSEWTNVIYKLNVTNSTVPPTLEPPQSSYLAMLDYIAGGNDSTHSTFLAPCQNCTSGAISIPGFPFGEYFHNTVYVGTNGIISFSQEFVTDVPVDVPVAFPSETDIKVYRSFLVAPYWANIDTRLDGHVSYQILVSGEGGSEAVSDRFEQVTNFINSENDPNFSGATWMLVATWYNVHPHPHGDSAEQDREDPYLQSTNNFQTVLISNGTKAYSIFTYECDTMQWSGEATIGINAGGSWYKSHPLSGRLHSNAIDCVHASINQPINNVVYDLAPVVPTGPVPPKIERLEIPFIVGNTSGIPSFSVPPFDDGATDAIAISLQGGFPFANSYQTEVYVGTNGIISFGEPFTSPSPQSFPTVYPFIHEKYLLAPFWADVDISYNGVGSIKYEVHTTASNFSGSIDLIGRVSNFISNKTETTFEGSWMLVALWDEVPPYGGVFGQERNSFQAIAITNGADSYALYTYKCGAMGWSGDGVIGYNGGSPTDYFFVHPLSGSDDAQTIACLEFPNSEWSNVLYNISIDNVVTVGPPVIVEPGQSSYLTFINKTGINQVVLRSCDDCSSDFISLPDVPFGNYRHSEAYISSNGFISFGEQVHVILPSLFPSTITEIHYRYIIAPYWADINTDEQGEIWYETHIKNEDRTSNDLLEEVSGFVNEQTEANEFSGTWMLVVTWDAVRPYSGHNEFITNENTFQAVVITNGSKTYTVFTYKCDLLTWSEEETIGYNAASDYFENHPLAGTTVTDALDCVHSSTDGSEWNNVVYDLVPGTVIGPTPNPPNSFGSCIEVGFNACCTSFDCIGSSPYDCFCDSGCHQFGDCCHDIEDICNNVPISLNATVNATLLIATQYTIKLLNGSEVDDLLPIDYSSVYIAIDYDYSRGYIYFSENIRGQILRANFAGSNRQVIVNTVGGIIDGIAVDWVNNKLYWTDALYLTVNVIDLESLERKTLISLDPGSTPRAIVVDPSTSYMYWTDWGSPAMIERASMDGSNRQVLHSTGLIWPNGLTIDYADQRIYWADANLDRIEYSNVNGSGRVVLETEANGLRHPFGITLDKNVLYWSDWWDQSIFSTHKLLGQNIVPIYENLAFLPSGIVAVSASRQSAMTNACEDQECSYLCLLSTITSGYTCVCPDGEELQPNGKECTNGNTTGNTTTTIVPPVMGSCASAGYTGCCNSTSGACSGIPSTCFCEIECVIFGDCCSDFFDLYVPVPIENLEVFSLSASSLNITWSQTADLQVCIDAYTRVEIVDYNGEVIFNETVTFEVTFLVVNQGLAKWIPYNVAVKTGNLLASSETTATVVFTEEGVPSVSPQNISIDWISSSEMNVSWEPLTLIEAKGFITSYIITYSPVDVTSTKKRQTGGESLEVPGNMSQVIIGNLEEGTAYSVGVSGNTATGVGVSSDLLSSDIGPAATGAPNVGTTDVGTAAPNVGATAGAAAGVIVVLIAVAVVIALLVGVLLVVRKRRRSNKFHGAEEYENFTNEDTLSRSASYDMPIDSTQEVPALSFGNPTYQTGEDAEETEARYASVSDAQYAAVSEAQYTSVSEPPPLYEDVTVKKIVSEEPNYQVVSELQVQSREVEHSENKQDLAEMEKEDLGPVVSPSREEEDTKK